MMTSVLGKDDHMMPSDHGHQSIASHAPSECVHAAEAAPVPTAAWASRKHRLNAVTCSARKSLRAACLAAEIATWDRLSRCSAGEPALDGMRSKAARQCVHCM